MPPTDCSITPNTPAPRVVAPYARTLWDAARAEVVPVVALHAVLLAARVEPKRVAAGVGDFHFLQRAVTREFPLHRRMHAVRGLRIGVALRADGPIGVAEGQALEVLVLGERAGLRIALDQ